jgi:hypothetical protein
MTDAVWKSLNVIWTTLRHVDTIESIKRGDYDICFPLSDASCRIIDDINEKVSFENKSMAPGDIDDAITCTLAIVSAVFIRQELVSGYNSDDIDAMSTDNVCSSIYNLVHSLRLNNVSVNCIDQPLSSLVLFAIRCDVNASSPMYKWTRNQSASLLIAISDGIWRRLNRNLNAETIAKDARYKSDRTKAVYMLTSSFAGDSIRTHKTQNDVVNNYKTIQTANAEADMKYGYLSSASTRYKEKAGRMADEYRRILIHDRVPLSVCASLIHMVRGVMPTKGQSLVVYRDDNTNEQIITTFASKFSFEIVIIPIAIADLQFVDSHCPFHVLLTTTDKLQVIAPTSPIIAIVCDRVKDQFANSLVIPNNDNRLLVVNGNNSAITSHVDLQDPIGVLFRLQSICAYSPLIMDMTMRIFDESVSDDGTHRECKLKSLIDRIQKELSQACSVVSHMKHVGYMNSFISFVCDTQHS